MDACLLGSFEWTTIGVVLHCMFTKTKCLPAGVLQSTEPALKQQKKKDITLWRIPLRWFLCIVLLFCKLCHTSFVTPHQLTWKCIHKPPVVVQAFGAETVKLWRQRGNEKKNCLPFLNRLLFQPSQLRFTLSHLAHWGRVEISQLVAVNWTKNKLALAKLAFLTYSFHRLPHSLLFSRGSNLIYAFRM